MSEDDDFSFGEEQIRRVEALANNNSDLDYFVGNSSAPPNNNNNNTNNYNNAQSSNSRGMMMTMMSHHHHQSRFRREGSVGGDHDPLLGDDTFITDDEPRPSNVVDPALLNVSFDRLPKVRTPPRKSTQPQQQQQQQQQQQTQPKPNPNNNKTDENEEEDAAADDADKTKKSSVASVTLPKFLSAPQQKAYANPVSLAYKIRDLNLRNLRCQSINKYREQQKQIKVKQEVKEENEGEATKNVDVADGEEKEEDEEGKKDGQEKKGEGEKVKPEVDENAFNNDPDNNNNNNNNTGDQNQWHPRRSRRWTAAENETFFRGLRQFGTDFSAIGRFFPERNRTEILRKYHAECKTSFAKVNEALRNRLAVDQEAFEAALHDWARKREMQDRGPLDEVAQNFLEIAGKEGASAIDAAAAADSAAMTMNGAGVGDKTSNKKNNKNNNNSEFNFGDDDDDDEDFDEDDRPFLSKDGMFSSFSFGGASEGGAKGKKTTATATTKRQPVIRQRNEYALDDDDDEFDLTMKSKKSNNPTATATSKQQQKSTVQNDHKNINSDDFVFDPFDPDEVPFASRIIDRDENTPLGLLFPQSPRNNNDNNTKNNNNKESDKLENKKSKSKSATASEKTTTTKQPPKTKQQKQDAKKKKNDVAVDGQSSSIMGEGNGSASADDLILDRMFSSMTAANTDE
jgi:hypothetical protein